MNLMQALKPGAEPGWIEYGCCVCDVRSRYAINSGVVVDQLSIRLGLSCHACGALMLIDHIQYPVDVSGTAIAAYHREADQPKAQPETPAEREERLRAAACGIVWDGDETETN